jgi:hypothetical protein
MNLVATISALGDQWIAAKRAEDEARAAIKQAKGQS